MEDRALEAADAVVTSSAAGGTNEQQNRRVWWVWFVTRSFSPTRKMASIVVMLQGRAKPCAYSTYSLKPSQAEADLTQS